jgi:outer membrane protein assembly factor BamA
MDVTYTITEGRQVFVSQIITEGLQHTRPAVVQREMRIAAGQPLSQSRILASQRRLYDLGVFNQVNFAVENPEGEEPQKNLLLQLEEARRWTFTYGLGFEVQTGSSPGTSQPQGRTGYSPRVSFDITRLNFRGRDQTILFKSRYGRLEKLGLFTFEAPHLFNRDALKFNFTTYYEDSRNVRTFTAQRLEASIGIEQRWSNVTTLLYRFSYRDVRVDPRTLVIDPVLIPLFSKPTRIGMPTVTYVRDRRDDPIDSHKGMYTTMDFGISAGAFGSEASFNRFLFQNSSYYSLGKRHKYVLARTTRVGMEEPFGNPAQVIPLPELLYAGGGNTQRGFAINQAGPRDPVTGFPIGGQGLFINQVELRFPPLMLPWVGDTVSPVLFHDMGNVFASAGDIPSSIVRFSQPHQDLCRSLVTASQCSYNYNPQALGLGVRYKTPIGPVRLDFGYDLNPPIFPITRESRIDQLAHFNFFFSIGQTF